MADTGTESIEIKASPERILEIVTDIEAYPDWMGAFERAEILEYDGDGRPHRAEFEVDARIKRVTYVLEYSYPQGGIAWESISGDVKEIKGSYILAPAGDATEVTYSYSIDPGFPVPGFLRRQAVKMMVNSALNDLRKKAES